jgi:hypothetical protein
MSDVKYKLQVFENVPSNLLSKPVIHVEKPMKTVCFVDVETTYKILSQYQSNYTNCVSIPESHRDLILGVENIQKGRPTDIHGVTNCGCENLSLIHFSSILQVKSFSCSSCIQQSIRNNRLRTWPTAEWAQCHCDGGILGGVRLRPFTKL